MATKNSRRIKTKAAFISNRNRVYRITSQMKKIDFVNEAARNTAIANLQKYKNADKRSMKKLKEITNALTKAKNYITWPENPKNTLRKVPINRLARIGFIDKNLSGFSQGNIISLYAEGSEWYQSLLFDYKDMDLNEAKIKMSKIMNNPNNSARKKQYDAWATKVGKS